MRTFIQTIILIIHSFSIATASADVSAERFWERYRAESDSTALDSLLNMIRAGQAGELAENCLQQLQQEGDLYGFRRMAAALGSYYSRSDQSEKLMQLALRNLDLAVQRNDSGWIARSHLHAGNAVKNQRRFREALQHYRQALQFQQNQQPTLILAGTYNNIGMMYRSLDREDSARIYHHMALDMRLKSGDKRGQAASLNNLAAIEADAGKYREARQLYRRAFALKQEMNDRWGMANIAGNIIITFTGENKLDSAFVAARVAQPLVEQAGSVTLTRNLHRSLFTLYQKSGDSRRALEHHILYKQFQDSLYNTDMDQRMNELKVQYETEKKEKEILKLEQVALQRLVDRNGVLALSALGFGLTVLLVFFMQRRKKEAELNSRIAQQQNSHLQELLEIRNRELTAHAMRVAKISDQAQLIKSKISDYAENQSADSRKSLARIALMFDEITVDEDAWREFDLRFTEVHGDFLDRLIAAYPDLTPVEVRICSLLRLNLSTKEVAEITNRNVRTIENTRFRIRQKLNLDGEQSLVNYLLQF